MPEPPKGMHLNSAKLKQWTGSDTVRARFLNENSFEFKPQFKLYLNTNDLPTATDTALFKSGRMVVIPFTRHFAEAEQDGTLKQQFATNGAKSAILNWLLAGWRAVRSEGLLPPSSVTSAIHEYSAESDTVRRFVEECLEPDLDSDIKTSTLLKMYQEWARANGLDGPSANTFKGELERTGFKVKRCRPKSGGNPTSLLLGYKASVSISGIISS